MLWDFDVDQILSANTCGVAAVIPDTDDICVKPLLDVNAVSYNCPNFPATDKVLLSPVDETTEREEILHNHLQEMMILLMPLTLIFRRGHWFSQELEGVMFVILFLQHNLIAVKV